MNEPLYNVRMHFNFVNPLTIELKGCGNLYITPGKDYFFINAPMNFINYLVQLKDLGVTYELTNNKKGCYQEIDLLYYNVTDPRYIMANIRKNLKPEEPEKKPKEEKREEIKVVLSSDDGITVEKEPVVDIKEPIAISKEPPVVEEIPTEPETTPVVEEPNETEGSVNEETPVVYTAEQLNKLGKPKLLEIVSDLGIAGLSDINTKRELKDAILAAQK